MYPKAMMKERCIGRHQPLATSAVGYRLRLPECWDANGEGAQSTFAPVNNMTSAHFFASDCIN